MHQKALKNGPEFEAGARSGFPYTILQVSLTDNRSKGRKVFCMTKEYLSLFRLLLGIHLVACASAAAQTHPVIQPGTFLMGSATNEQDRFPNEDPQRTVTLSRGFWMRVVLALAAR